MSKEGGHSGDDEPLLRIQGGAPQLCLGLREAPDGQLVPTVDSIPYSAVELFPCPGRSRHVLPEGLGQICEEGLVLHVRLVAGRE